MFGVMVQPMSPSDQWLFETLNTMRQETTEQHQRLRGDVNAGFDRLREELKSERETTSGVRDRVLVLETQREEDRRHATRMQWIIGVLVTIINVVFGWFSKR